MENRFINASHDFTEQDQVALEWLKRKQALEVRGELVRAGKQTAKMVVKDTSFLLAVAALVVLAVVVGIFVWLG